jgi:NADPH-dependent 2,4-dienoyl-CoA reductase/sulfur reductase-like enzyme
MSRVDVLIVGAGPAGMAAAIVARRMGLEVTVIDDQPEPGGQIWRSIETTRRRDAILGPSYVEGRAVAAAFRASGALYQASAQLWQIEPGFRAFVSRGRQAHVIEAKTVILATGAQERPIPFPGWTLPGVLTVGAAQILLKNAGEIPAGPVWIAGSGPLPLLYAGQLLRAGGRIAGYLDTTPRGQWRAALPHLPAALRASSHLLKGLGWTLRLRMSATPVIAGVMEIEALGHDRIRALRYQTTDGAVATVPADTLLVHEGVVPNLHAALSLDCTVAWNPAQECYAPVVDPWGESSCENLFIAGDSAGIAGGRAAQLRGELAALAVAVKVGRMSDVAATAAARPIRRKLDRELALRPFLDALFRPRPQVFAPPDETIVCRCEEITAREIRALASVGCPGPNQIKATTRAGMGPCQGRQCGYTVTRILATAQDRSPAEVGFFHIRPPLKPVTLGELASLDPHPGA